MTIDHIEPGSQGKVWVALITKNSYLQGLLVLHRSMQLTTPPTSYPLIAMITKEFPESGRKILRERGIGMKECPSLKPKKKGVGFSKGDERFEDTWTKVTVFDWTEYERIITLDCDMIFRQNNDELMNLELPADHIAGAHACACNPRRIAHYPKDWIPENCFHTSLASPSTPLPFPLPTDAPRAWGLINGGLIILKPNKEIFEELVEFIAEDPRVESFKFADQDLYATYFAGKWKPVSFRHNSLKTLRAIHPNLWTSDSEPYNVHYILDKPWQSHLPEGDVNYETHKWWWDAYAELKKEMLESGQKESFEVVDEWVVKPGEKSTAGVH